MEVKAEGTTMNQLSRNFDLLAILMLVLLLGIAQAPRTRAAHILNVANSVDIALPHFDRLVCSR
jgi:hypothetical protein